MRAGARRGFSLVEMMAATALVAGTLAPALAVMRDAMAVSREGVRRSLVANYAVQVLESQAALVMQNWTNGTVDGQLLRPTATRRSSTRPSRATRRPTAD